MTATELKRNEYHGLKSRLPKLIGVRRPPRRPTTGRRSNWEEKREGQLWPPVLLWVRKRKGRLKTLRVRVSQFPAITSLQSVPSSTLK